MVDIDRTPDASATRLAEQRLRARRALRITLALIAACAAWVAWTLRPTPPPRVPPELIGVWTTDRPEYADRFLEITERTLVYGLGEHRVSIHPIVGVSSRGASGLSHVLRTTAKEGHEETLEVTLEPGPPPTLRLAHNDAGWQRAPAPAEAP
jgi:hypothetical protein